MPGNPKECRKHALNCQRLAETATNEHDRQQLRALANSWLALAAELESMESLLDTLRQVKYDDKQVKSNDEKKRRVGRRVGPYGTAIVVTRRLL